MFIDLDESNSIGKNMCENHDFTLLTLLKYACAILILTSKLNVSCILIFFQTEVALRWMIPPMVVHPEKIDFRRFV